MLPRCQNWNADKESLSYVESCVAALGKNLKQEQNCQTNIIKLAHGIENQQTCKALFKNFTQICDVLQSSNTLSPHFRVFLGCKCIHNLKIMKDFGLEITAHHNENYILVIQIIQKIFCLNTWHNNRYMYLSEPVHSVKQSATNDLSICLI